MLLSSLPLELLAHIAKKVPRLKDRKSLRLTCVLLGEVLKPHVLASVTLNIHGHNLEPGFSLLQALVEEQEALQAGSAMISGLSKHIRKLYVAALAPTFYPESDADFEKKQKLFDYLYQGEEQIRKWHTVEPRSPECENKLRLLLKPALESLDNLTTIHWSWHYSDSDWTLDTLYECLESDKFLSKIKDFTLSYRPENCIPPLRIPKLPELRRLSFCIYLGDAELDRLFQHPTISNNPNLTTLSITLQQDHFPHYMSFPGSIPETVVDLDLNGLKFANLEHVISGNLTSLDLSASKMANDESWASLWEILSLQQIRLQKLALGQSSSPEDMRKLLEYLSSYSGLESFSLTKIHWYPSYSAHAVYFYTHILPRHAKTLVNLELKPLYESSWCVGADSIDAIEQCRSLRSLSIRVNHKGLDPDPDPNPERASVGSLYEDQNIPELCDQNSVHLLLQTIALSLPNLEKLTIEPATTLTFINDPLNFAMNEGQFYLGKRRRIRASVESFARRSDQLWKVFKWVQIYVHNQKMELEPRWEWRYIAPSEI
ncbi:hypothetical protein C8R42DRAFT_719864 [Lentinula raphanica]|nr:hypothetical protein C8R42DRAFT_719864 [Lentinula raphanica]